jgi:hypothetical protein
MRGGGEEGMALPLPVQPPHDRYTVEDWLNLPENIGRRIELIDGSLVVRRLTAPFPVRVDPVDLLGRRRRPV